ncbi:hypothetical protein ASD43_08375 [Microbacterium sp. Root553]|nr:hypothetical protein ASD43_08375 [Microbacterium sp. Root553]
MQRWWDGYQWTQHTYPRGSQPQLAGAGPGSLYNGAKDAESGKNSAGAWSLVLGLVSILAGIPRGLTLLSVALGIAAIVWGCIGLARASRFGVKRGAAIAGLVLGVLTLVITLVWLAAL